MVRLSLCCIFREHPIKFRQTTAAALKKLGRDQQLDKLSTLCLSNLVELKKALLWVADNKIGGFRVLSPLFPRMTHPDVAYSLDILKDAESIELICEEIREFRKEKDIRMSLHPDQFNVLSSPHAKVVRSTLAELEYQGLLAEKVGAEVINIHAGGVYADKTESLRRFKANSSYLSERVRTRLTLENDDRSYTPTDLLPFCLDMQIPFVYDIHHHRCLPCLLTTEEATNKTIELWEHFSREPYFHISSPRNGYQSKKPQPHADYIRLEDFPETWLDLSVTIDVEAKAKELAVLQLQKQLSSYTSEELR